MKRGKFILFLFAALWAGSALSQYKTPLEYMNAISTEYRDIQKDMWDYTSAVAHGKSARKVEKTRMALIQTVYDAKGKVKRMPDWDGDGTYRDSVVSFLNIYYLILKEDYAKIVDMEEIAERSYNDMEAYMNAKDAANDKMNEASKMVGEQQRIFAEKHGITLLEADDELNQKMIIADRVYEYYNVLYLIFFKAYVQEKYLIEAINNKDVSAIEQNKNALASAANEGLEKIEGIGAFEGDNTVLVALKDILKFYKEEAEEKIPVITDYFIKTENFETIKKSFDEIKPAKRTQQDVDQYNQAVNDVNAAVNAYNTTNEQLGKDRAKYLDEWNKASAKFTDKHVPKGKAE